MFVHLYSREGIGIFPCAKPLREEGRRERGGEKEGRRRGGEEGKEKGGREEGRRERGEEGKDVQGGIGRRTGFQNLHLHVRTNLAVSTATSSR